jgi:2'-5' RNA ligase
VPEPDQSIRAFLALEIGSTMRERLAELQESLAQRVRGVRWVRPEGIHLTLRFLGQGSAAALDRLKRPLADAAQACPAGDAWMRGLGVFPERGAPRVLWIGLGLPEPALLLQAACERAALEAGFPREDRPFKPHLTLGRWRDRAPRPELPDADLGTTPLERLVLYRSQLKPTGAVYTALDAFPLGR